MNGAKGGKASVRSPEHFPIEKARAVHKARAAVYRKQREDEGGSRPAVRQLLLPLD